MTWEVDDGAAVTRIENSDYEQVGGGGTKVTSVLLEGLTEI